MDIDVLGEMQLDKFRKSGKMSRKLWRIQCYKDKDTLIHGCTNV